MARGFFFKAWQRRHGLDIRRGGEFGICTDLGTADALIGSVVAESGGSDTGGGDPITKMVEQWEGQGQVATAIVMTGGRAYLLSY